MDPGNRRGETGEAKSNADGRIGTGKRPRMRVGRMGKRTRSLPLLLMLLLLLLLLSPKADV